ncbi:hypothetical protein BURKHO8Y_210092 [Burkholderia sp. 8Y]|nr:hypothetical protein BURKHO8Y_210092 [Burkholderia sp. 8Y]
MWCAPVEQRRLAHQTKREALLPL